MAGSSSLLPKEHGAYGELAFPLATGLILSGLAWPSLALAAAAVSFFLANEPLAILLGARGQRLRDQLEARARVRGGILLILGVLLGVGGLVGSGSEAWPSILLPSGAALLLVPVVLAGKQKTVPGELLVATAFTTLLLPLALPWGAQPMRVVLAAAVWWVSFALGTLEVHAIKARHKKKARNRWAPWVSPVASGLVLGAALWMALGQAAPVLRAWGPGGGMEAGAGGAWGWVPEATRLLPPAAAAILPPALAIFVLSLLKVHPRHLKRVGWTLIGANTLTLVLLLQG